MQSLRDFEKKHGRRPTSADTHRRMGLPTYGTIKKHCGFWSNAYVAAFGEPPSQTRPAKDEDTAEVVRQLDEGRTLAQLAAVRGITGQALGRRVARYRRVYGLLPPLHLRGVTWDD